MFLHKGSKDNMIVLGAVLFPKIILMAWYVTLCVSSCGETRLLRIKSNLNNVSVVIMENPISCSILCGLWI